MRLRHALVSLLVALGCHVSMGSGSPDDAVSTTPEPRPATAGSLTTGTPAPVLEADLARLRSDVEFLAADAQMGRSPGTEADGRVQQHIEAQMQAAGLQPAFADGFRQLFTVTDGVRATAPSRLAVGPTAVPHALVPFGSSSAEPLTARLVFVGHGITTKGKGTGNYEGLEDKVRGAIVVALGGAPSDNPHLSPVSTRPQSKLIAARDHGAVGFVLWEPEMINPYPNHGEANDLRLPAVWVGKEGTTSLLRAFGSKAKGKDGAAQAAALEPGRRSRKRSVLSTAIEPVQLRTANVSGVLPGQPGGPVVVIGAHMDHLGLGTSHSLAPGVEAVHNGADDNASGVAVVLEMARVLGALPVEQRPYTLHFVTFGAEEMGLLGSKHYVEKLPAALRKRMVAMLNFDMVGRLGQDQGLIVSGTGTSSTWPQLLERSQGAQSIRHSEDGYGASDQTSFYEAGLPVLHFFTGSHSDYHKPTDDVDKINFEGAKTIAGIALTVVHTLATEGIEPDFIKVARKAPGRGGFRVSLGTIPDYGAQVDGVRLSGVRESGAAAKAGLQKGDVIQKMGDREVHNLDDYMATFAVLEPGKTVEVTVLRDGKTVTLSMTPDAPQRR